MKEMLRENARLLLLSVLILSNCATALAYYHPEEGRFLSRDPIGEIGGINLHGFVRNNAINFTDKYGLSVGGDALGLWLASLYAGRALDPLGFINNQLITDFLIPGQVIAGTEEMKGTIEVMMVKHANEVCAKGIGTHPVSARGQVTFNGAVLGFVLNNSSWSDTGTGVVTTDKKCKSCKKYSLDTKWTFRDEIDWNSFSELSATGGYFDPNSPALLQLYGIVEGLADLAFDKLRSANYKIRGYWREKRAGCCE